MTRTIDTKTLYLASNISWDIKWVETVFFFCQVFFVYFWCIKLALTITNTLFNLVKLLYLVIYTRATYSFIHMVKRKPTELLDPPLEEPTETTMTISDPKNAQKISRGKLLAAGYYFFLCWQLTEMLLYRTRDVACLQET